MVSGKRFHEEEILFVKDNMHEFPSIVARSLGLYYPNHNGGSRNTQSVARLMNKIREDRDPNGPDTESDLAVDPARRIGDTSPKVSVIEDTDIVRDSLEVPEKAQKAEPKKGDLKKSEPSTAPRKKLALKKK